LVSPEYVAVMDSVPAVLNAISSDAVPPAGPAADAPAGTTVTGPPTCVVPLLKKVTVPVGPCVLPLVDAMFAVSVTPVPVPTGPGTGLIKVVVPAATTVTLSFAGAVGAL